MENRWCTACGRLFLPRPQSPRQTYCTEVECQRERRRLWQQAKRRSDPDYAGNQRQAQQSWLLRNPAYWQNYREQHPDYARVNRERQRQRNGRKAEAAIAKMDAWTPSTPLPDGIYELRPQHVVSVAKMGVWLVRLTVISKPSRS